VTTFPGSPRVLKGALIALDPTNPLGSFVLFQYNPDTVTRTLRAKAAGAEADRGEILRLKGPPDESIKLDVEVDAADQLAQGDPVSALMGVHPTLARLELMLYPKSAFAVANEALQTVGLIEIVPPEAPLTILAWGAQRLLPVRMTGLTITEEAFDPGLNPIRARVGLELDVLSYDELGLLSPGGAMFMVHHIAKEVTAKLGGLAAIASFSFEAGAGVGG
jgi:hypothetical protein